MIRDLVEWNYEEETDLSPRIVLSRAEKGRGAMYAMRLV